MLRLLMIACLAACWLGPSLAADTRNVSRTGGDEFRRIALVVGNNDYANISKLKNARQDAIAMAATFRSLGFEVIEKLDVNQRDLKSAVRELESRLNKQSIGVFFYAGHGIQVKGNNYLLPVDIPYPESEREVEDEAIELNQTLLNISKASKFTMFIVDACRDKPIQFKDTRDAGNGGLAKPATVPDGVVVLYSAGAGQKALDSLGPRDTNPNGLFTRELLKQIKTPGLPVTDLAQNVYERVKAQAASVNHEQTPGYYGQSERFSLVPGPMPNAATAVSAPTAAPGPLEIELEYWRAAEKAGSKTAYEGYLKKYPMGQFASLAQDAIQRLNDKAQQEADGGLSPEMRRKLDQIMSRSTFPQAAEVKSPQDVERANGLRRRFMGLVQDVIASAPQNRKFQVRDQINQDYLQFDKLIRNGRVDEAEKILVATESKYPH